MNYQQQAQDFLNKTNTKFSAVFLRNGVHFEKDKDFRDIYTITLERGDRKYSFEFGQSIMDSQYYVDKVRKGSTYTLNGSSRTGNYSITDIKKYQSGGIELTLVKGKVPDRYSVLACLTKYDPGTFEDFCNELGYDVDSISVTKTYDAVCKEWDGLQRLFNDDEMELLREIQ